LKKLKKLKIAGACFGIMLSSISYVSTAEAGMFHSLMTNDWETVGTKHYKIEAYGYDVRVYEWTPKENPDVRCVFTAGHENSSGTACYKIKGAK